MSLHHSRKPHDLEPDRLKPAPGAPILRPSVEAKRVSDLCTGAMAPSGARERVLAWLAEGAREVTWALCSLPHERWAEVPPSRLSEWPALRHARHLALRETHLTLPAVRHAVGNPAAETLPSAAEVEHADAAWDAEAAINSAEAIVRGIGDTRYELLHWLEAAPDEAWERRLAPAVVPDVSGSPCQLDWLMLHARQHELEHLAAMWRVALYWDRVSPTTALTPSLSHRDAGGEGLPLHPADRLEESD